MLDEDCHVIRYTLPTVRTSPPLGVTTVIQRDGVGVTVGGANVAVMVGGTDVGVEVEVAGD